jgi:hypothetical protein
MEGGLLHALFNVAKSIQRWTIRKMSLVQNLERR